MINAKSQFYKNGAEHPKKPDIVIDLKRPSESKMATWSPEEKRNAIKFLAMADANYQAFRKLILEACKQTQ